jgi:predicted metalloprotease with PDZ domain
MINCKISYKGFDKKIFLGNSLFSNKEKGSYKISLNDLVNSIFCAGDFRTRTISEGGKKITVAITGEFEHTDEEVFSSVGKIILGECKFWNDKESAYFFTLFMPTDDKGNSGGTAYYNSFAIFQSPDVKLADGILQTISHEYLHKWLGTTLMNPGPDESHKWFSEGFTDYYSLKILYTIGILSKDDYLKQLNKNIMEYYLSPKFKSANSEIIGKYWSDENWRLLSYRRGLSIAFMLDSKVMENKTSSLDDLIRTLYHQSAPSMLFSDSLFNNLVIRFTAKDVLAAISEANNGHNELLTSQLLSNKIYPVAIKEVSRFEMGFDLKQSITAKTIVGLRPGSNAEKAGLKENMKITSLNYKSNSQSPVTVGVIENGEKKLITYIPIAAESIQAPQIAINQDLAE